MKIAIAILALIIGLTNLLWVIRYFRTKKRLEREKTAIANFYKSQLVTITERYNQSVKEKQSYRTGNHSNDIDSMANVVQNYHITNEQ